MKKLIKVLTAVLAVIVLALALASCEGGVSIEEAKKTTNEFLTLAIKGDYAEAEKFIHPDYDISEEKLKEFFDGYFDMFEIDASKGYEIKKYTGFNVSFYSSSVDGSKCTLSFNIEIDGKLIKAESEVVRNKLGYGVTFFNFSTPQ